MIGSRQKKQIEELQRQIAELQETLEKQEKKQEKKQQEILDAANIIHLYASLAEEEAKSDELRQKQTEIKKLAEMMMQKFFDTP